MKKLITIILFFLISSTVSMAQDTAYKKAMKKEIGKLLQADSISALQESANAFNRIANMNTKEWLPLYYEALAYTYQGLSRPLSLDQKDVLLAQAEELIHKADVLSPENAEIITLKGFILMGKLSADPANRGQSLSGTIMATYGKAIVLNNKNPRALGLMAQMEFGMAQFFGNGTDKACGLAKQSMLLFESQDEEKLKDEMLPTWGKGMTEQLMKQCK